ncbi:MAG: sigma-70 family RNA polymerase sigma factor [Chitinispirillaceae bacterium]|nr:sigma-70 family RNA polymerase sigma factor [Chitinispirillaceae bacterium]
MTHQNRSAMAEFFRREYGRLAGFVRTLIDEAADFDSEDIVQDVALNLFSRADVTAPIEDVASYVYQALRNRVVDLFRRRRETVSLDAPVRGAEGGLTFKDIFPDNRPGIERVFEDDKTKHRIIEGIEKLSDEQKAVLIATEFHGRSFAELSMLWRVPIGTLLARKSRAIAKLRHIAAEEKP